MAKGFRSRSRRVGGLKPTDYDHEIDLIDHDATQTSNMATPRDTAMVPSSTTSQLINHDDDAPGNSTPPIHNASSSMSNHQNIPEAERSPSNGDLHEAEMPNGSLRPSIQVRQPTSQAFHGDHPQVKPKKPRDQREAVIDILYQNERGGFFCGIALFSGQALGGLDPPAWTNTYHKASPTSIYTAQVPDPSWEWAWPEWRINHQEGVDENGWEYSFAFSKKLSWHGPRWYNSFVRRRAWTRKRVRKRQEDISTDPHMLNTDYFTVRSAIERTSRSQCSQASSRAVSRITSKASMSNAPSVEIKPELEDIEDMETLLKTLRHARIDREKLEAVESYLQNGIDLMELQAEMHEIMRVFVFQASRRILLSRLMQIYDETSKELEEKNSPVLQDKKVALKEAVKHADEEVRRLAYWSDVKQMAENGEAKGAVDDGEGWHSGWQGVDQSGAAQPNNGKLPDK